MAKKTYRSLTGIQYTFPVKVNDNKVRWVSFTGDQLEFVTSNKQIQDAIEKNPRFTEKLIGVSLSEAKDEDKVPVEPKEFPEVEFLNDAVAVLRGDPYRIHYSKLKSKDSIMAVAKELGVSFPNLPNE